MARTRAAAALLLLVSACAGHGSPRTSPAPSRAPSSAPSAAATPSRTTGDFDGDGHADSAVLDPATERVTITLHAGTVVAGTLFHVPNGGPPVLVGSVRLTGRTDALVVEQFASVHGDLAAMYRLAGGKIAPLLNGRNLFTVTYGGATNGGGVTCAYAADRLVVTQHIVTTADQRTYSLTDTTYAFDGSTFVPQPSHRTSLTTNNADPRLVAYYTLRCGSIFVRL